LNRSHVLVLHTLVLFEPVGSRWSATSISKHLRRRGFDVPDRTVYSLLEQLKYAGFVGGYSESYSVRVDKVVSTAKDCSLDPHTGDLWCDIIGALVSRAEDKVKRSSNSDALIRVFEGLGLIRK
jgi:Fe2+ or Zn2+ uptake regulation protein